MKRYSLPKSSRLSLRKEIDELFDQAQVIKVYPLRCSFCSAEHRSVMVSVPKRIFHNAVDRNYLKRRMREAYRLNCSIMGDLNLRIAFHYTACVRLSYKEIEDATREILQKLVERGMGGLG
ncbi:MAG: ribonuclease P protein component [Mucinivorans sp.]